MGTSNLLYHNNRYRGSLSEDTCNILESLIDLKESNGVVADLSHIIYNLPDSTVQNIIDEYESFGEIREEYNKPIGTLRDYQTIGVAFLYYAGDCILGDSVGMGKTVETAGLINLINLYNTRTLGHPHRYLMVTEKKVATQVRSEMIKYTGEFCYLLPDATERRIRKFSEDLPSVQALEYSVVGTHALLKSSGFISWLIQYEQAHGKSPFDTLIVDESSVLGGSETGFMKEFKALRRFFNRVVMLNATPLESSISVLYNQLNLLDNKFMPTKQNFQREYCVMDYSGMFPRQTNRYKNKEQFKNSIAYRYYASTRRDNGAVMDNCTGDIVTSMLSFEQKRLLTESQLTQMVYDCPSYIDSNVRFNEVNVPKLGSLRKLLEGECADADSIIMYVHFREAQDYISKWLTEQGYSNRVLNGATPEKDVDKIINGFKNSEFTVLITNVQKGLNFGNCDYCIFYSIMTNPSSMVQFEGRITRGFDIYNKHVYLLCSLGREFNNLRTTVKDRAEAMEAMTSTDYSVVLTLLQRLKKVSSK